MIKSKVQALVYDHAENINSLSNSVDHILKKKHDIIYRACQESLKKKTL